MATDTTINNLIINKLTKAQYDAIPTKSDTELYLVLDTIDSIPTSGSTNLVESGGVYTALSDKEDKMGIITVSATSLAPSVNKYYRFTADVGTLTVTLPTVTDTTKVASIVFYLTTGASPAVTFTSSHPVLYQEGFSLDAGKTYEINALFNGAAWVLMAAEINTGS